MKMTVSHPETIVHFEELDETIQRLLATTANELARETQFVQRKSKLDGAKFVQALVFGWMANPEASYSFLQEMLEIAGCDVSAQALEQRMSPQAADFLLSLLHAFVWACVGSEPVMNELLSRFEGVYLQDGTVISLPEELKALYRGCGGNTKESGLSALRVQVRLNLSTGALQGPWIAEAVQCERKGPGSTQQTPPPAGSLSLNDSGYITLQEIKEHQENERFWLSHARSDWQITDARGVKQSLPQFLGKHAGQQEIDEWVTLGSRKSQQQRVRLIAFAVSPERQEQREQADKQSKRRAKGSRGDAVVGKKHEPTKSKRHRQRKGAKRIQLAGWTILICNVPQDLLSPQEARVLARARWQIELLWRLWKERGQLDIWRSAKPMRILCEVYAKLMGCMIQHWVILMGCWQQPNRSMVKASLVVGALAPAYLLSWSGPKTPAQVLQATGLAMKRAQLNRRPTRPSTAQLLEQASRKLA